MTCAWPWRACALALLACASGLGACDAGGPHAGSDGRIERIVLVSIDTLRADHVGCYGAAGAETPALDALAAEGVRFATAISPAPITLPSHTTLLTGRDPPQHGVRHNGFFQLPPDVPTLADQLRGAGFATAAFVSAFVLDSRFGLDRGFEHYDDRLGVSRSSGAPGAVAERRGDRTVDAALAWLAEAPERFFLWVHLYDPHADYLPPAPWSERFAGRRYDGEIAFADAQLARLRAAVAERFDGGTLWWVASDHGEALGEHAERTHSFGVYEATQHVPLIAAGPGLPQGKVVADVVALADVAPTTLALAGLPALAGATGGDLAPVLRGDGGASSRPAWVETLATQIDMGWSPLLGVRTATHKYVRAPEPELYDLRSDPRELSNRAHEEPALAAQLERLVEERAQGRPVALSFEPDASERAQLEALGYVQRSSDALDGEGLGRVGGIDPKHGAAELAKLDELNALLAQRRGAEALAVYDRIEQRGYGMLVLGAEAAIEAGQLERAEREARRALALMEQAEPWILIGNAQILAGRFPEAKQSFERAAALDPEKASPLLAFGVLAEREGRLEEAARYYEQARAVPVPSSEAYWRAAALAIERGQRSEAQRLLAEVPQGDLREPAAAHRLAHAERKAGRPELALTRVEGALQNYPWSVALWLLKGELLDQAGKLEEALVARREALRLAPERGDAENALAWTLARLGRDLPEAEQHIEAALGRLGRLPPLLDTFASVRVAQGRYADALALADEGLASAADAPRVDLLFRRAEALAGLGRREGAEQALALAQREAAARPSPASTWPESERRVQRLLGAES
jgi:arylsulfatase A-like enzyme/tetratricopeptide (TPR) repeat protein